MPFIAIQRNYDVPEMGSKQLVLDNQQHFTVHSIRFGVNYDKRFSATSEMPKGEPVYVLKGGEIVDTLINGESVSKRRGTLSGVAWWLIVDQRYRRYLNHCLCRPPPAAQRAEIASPT